MTLMMRVCLGRHNIYFYMLFNLFSFHHNSHHERMMMHSPMLRKVSETILKVNIEMNSKLYQCHIHGTEDMKHLGNEYVF